jgi:pyruvate dehydrogenase E2 component (dihydrolipoamide acetyltransferase)
MPDVTMPRLSDSMEEGTILKWLKSDGDEVSRGEELVEIETDKATMTYEADQTGTLHIVAGEGDTLPIGDVIARIGEGDGATPSPAAAESEDGGEPAPEPQPEPQPEPAPAQRASNGESEGGHRLKASPVARRMARELSVDLDGMEGSGPGGRIVKADVEAAADGDGAGKQAPAPAAPETPAEQPAGRGEVEHVELSRTQQLIARRMAESKATVPHFSLRMDIDMEQAAEVRAQLKDAAGEQPAPSFNDFVVKACALALREFPKANGAYRDGRFELYSRVNVGVAVAGRDALVVPTIFDADRKSLGQIARESRAVAERVRAGEITPPELSGSTFSVSNLGMYGIHSFVPVINPPQAAILGVGAMEPTAVVLDGEVQVRTRMRLTLVCDHRILYGADAAEFLGRIRQRLEQPLALAL